MEREVNTLGAGALACEEYVRDQELLRFKYRINRLLYIDNKELV